MLRLFFLLITLVVRALQVALRSRSSLVLENIALRQQVGVLTKTRPRPPLDNADRAFWVAMKCARRNWAQLLFIVEPETVVKWHRELFRRYWTSLSRRRHGPGRPRMDREIRELIRRMALENDWGAPRIHGELEKLGFTVSEATVSPYMPRRPAKTDVVQRWLAFLRNHKEGIAAMDFFTVPTGRRGHRPRRASPQPSIRIDSPKQVLQPLGDTAPPAQHFVPTCVLLILHVVAPHIQDRLEVSMAYDLVRPGGIGPGVFAL